MSTRAIPANTCWNGEAVTACIAAVLLNVQTSPAGVSVIAYTSVPSAG